MTSHNYKSYRSTGDFALGIDLAVSQSQHQIIKLAQDLYNIYTAINK